MKFGDDDEDRVVNSRAQDDADDKNMKKITERRNKIAKFNVAKEEAIAAQHEVESLEE